MVRQVREIFLTRRNHGVESSQSLQRLGESKLKTFNVTSRRRIVSVYYKKCKNLVRTPEESLRILHLSG